ncbi:hypothetical protein GCM10023310_72250 [Paenibacillus vulneris]|uniref:GNAT family acetyltransferase n=1 Tax=Paenibacillus vulneris TaxID=1133364 RepID=A0ABW3UGN5_9BACL
MKATIKNLELEGTPREFFELLSLMENCKKNAPTISWYYCPNPTKWDVGSVDVG